MEFISGKVICPYYRKSTKNVIKCEGGHCFLFDSREGVVKRIEEYCGTYDYSRCEVAKELNEKYGE